MRRKTPRRRKEKHLEKRRGRGSREAALLIEESARLLRQTCRFPPRIVGQRPGASSGATSRIHSGAARAARLVHPSTLALDPLPPRPFSTGLAKTGQTDT